MKFLVPISVLFVFLSCNQPTKRLERFSVHGIDVSHYQSYVNWEMVSDQGIHFAFAKATEGEEHRDSLFCHNWLEMKRVGIKRGAYHFFRPTVSPESQAGNFIDLVEMEPGDLPPVLDVEVTDGVSKPELLAAIRTWLFLVEIEYNIKPVIYTSQRFFNTYIAEHFEDYPVWIARYSAWRKPRLASRRNWHFWQYGDRGNLEGIAGKVDFNVFKGDFIDLEEMCLAPAEAISLK